MVANQFDPEMKTWEPGMILHEEHRQLLQAVLLATGVEKRDTIEDSAPVSPEPKGINMLEEILKLEKKKHQAMSTGGRAPWWMRSDVEIIEITDD